MKRTKAPAGPPLPPAPVVILCRPQIGENVGAATRAMLNFGLTELRLVQPACGWPNAKAVVTASGAVPVLNGITVHPTLEDAIADLHHVLATTARRREMDKPVIDGAAAAGLARDHLAHGRRVGLVFGAERTGLENAELLLADALVTFRTNPAFSSLNLAQSVLLMAYEWSRTAALPAPPPMPAAEPAALKGEVDGLLGQLLAALDEADFFKSPHARGSLSAAVKVMIEKRGWTTPEVNLMRGIVKELATARLRRPS